MRGAAPECVFRLDVTERSDLRVSLETNDFDGALALYDASARHAARAALRRRSARPATCITRGSRLALGAGRYLVAVDGANGEAGEFELFAELEPLADDRGRVRAAPALTPGVPVRDSTRGGEQPASAPPAAAAREARARARMQVDEPARVRIRQQAEYDGSLYLRARCEDASQ